MVIGLKLRALNKLAYLLYCKRVKRNKAGNQWTDWQKSIKILNFLEKRSFLLRGL